MSTFAVAIRNPQVTISRRSFLTAASVFVFATPENVFAHVLQSEQARRDAAAPFLPEVHRAILLAAGYLQRACGPDGRFVYSVDVQTGAQSPSYNIVRHAGAIHALAMLQRQYPSVETHEAMVRATGYLRRLYLGPAAEPDLLVVWSKPLPDHKLTVLGASGLGLLALAEIRQQSPKAVPLAELQALGRFLILQQRENGSFASKYSLSGDSEDAFESLYYPGEAVLGLLALYELDHSPKWLAAAIQGLTYLARSRRSLAQLPADHWALIATARLFSICDTQTCAFPREELPYHAERICASILRESVISAVQSDATPNPREPERTTPIATRMEGLIAAVPVLSDEELRNQVTFTVERGIQWLLKAQIKSGSYAGGMPGDIGGPSSRAEHIRIDYVQHALSAWLLYTKT